MANVTVEVTAKITEIEEQERRMRVVIGRLKDPVMIKKFSEKLEALEAEKYRLRSLAEQGISLDQMVSLPPKSTSSTVTSNGTQVDTVVSGNANANIVVNGEQIVGDSTEPPMPSSESSTGASVNVATSSAVPSVPSPPKPAPSTSSGTTVNASISAPTPEPIPSSPEPISSAKLSNQEEEKEQAETGVEDKEASRVKFSKPSQNQKFVSGDDVAVVMDATASSEVVARIKLYINDEFIRGEGAAPYEWGAANSNSAKDDAKLFNNLPPGSHTIKAAITFKSGLETTEEVNIIMESAKNDAELDEEKESEKSMWGNLIDAITVKPTQEAEKASLKNAGDLTDRVDRTIAIRQSLAEKTNSTDKAKIASLDALKSKDTESIRSKIEELKSAASKGLEKTNSTDKAKIASLDALKSKDTESIRSKIEELKSAASKGLEKTNSTDKAKITRLDALKQRRK